MWGFIPHAVGEKQDERKGLGFSRICKCLCNGLSSGFSPLSFSPVGGMQVTLTIDNQTQEYLSLPYGGGQVGADVGRKIIHLGVIQVLVY